MIWFNSVLQKVIACQGVDFNDHFFYLAEVAFKTVIIIQVSMPNKKKTSMNVPTLQMHKYLVNMVFLFIMYRLQINKPFCEKKHDITCVAFSLSWGQFHLLLGSFFYFGVDYINLHVNVDFPGMTFFIFFPLRFLLSSLFYNCYHCEDLPQWFTVQRVLYYCLGN